MTVGTIYSLYNGKTSCKYLCIGSYPGGWDLRRLMKAKTKADGNRFPEIMTINIGANTTKQKK